MKNIFSRKKNNSYIKSKEGFRKDLDCYMMSSMESNVFRFYKWAEKKYGKIKVEYESKVFRFAPNRYNISVYIPDFKVTSGKDVWYIEVKGKMDDTARQKAKLLSKNYPRVRLFFITPVEYGHIKELYSKEIPNWE